MAPPEVQALSLASGAACAIFFGYVFSSQINPSHGFLCLAEHLAAGIVLSATIFELAPIIPHGLDTLEFMWVSVGLCTGFLFLLLVRQFVGCHGHGDRKCEPGCGSGHAGCGIGTTYTLSGIGSGFNFGTKFGSNSSACMAVPTEAGDAENKDAVTNPVMKQSGVRSMLNRLFLCGSAAEKTSLLGAKPTKIAWNRVAAIWIDITVDGFLVGIATVAQGDTHENPGFIVAIALAIEILFLGTIVAPIFNSRRALGLAVSVCLSLSILAAAFTGAHVLASFVNTGPFYCFVAFGISALVWLVCEELLLQSHVINGSRFWLTLTFFLGFYFVLVIRALENAIDLSHGDVDKFNNKHSL